LAEAKKAQEEERRRIDERRQLKAKEAAEAKRVAEMKAKDAEERRLAEREAAKKAREAKKAAEPPAKAAEPKQVPEPKRTAEPRQAAKPAPHSYRQDAPSPTCEAAGTEIGVPGWYVVKEGDTLWAIAKRHYGAGRRYRSIHAANRRRMRSPHSIHACQRVYLPPAVRRT